MRVLIFFLAAAVCCSCGREFLDEKPTARQRVPSTLADYLGLMDNTGVMNATSHALGMMGSDEYFVDDGVYGTFPVGVNYNYQKRAYTWEREIFEGNEVQLLDWNEGYKRILWANLALEGAEKLKDQGAAGEVDLLRGIALFHRAWNYYNLAQLFCAVYDPATAASEDGLPLRLESDLTLNIPRADLEATYTRIRKDMEDAMPLLPDRPETNFRPGKAAVHTLLSRVYLQMGAYDKAFAETNEALGLHDELIDYNAVEQKAGLTFPPHGQGNAEVVFMASFNVNNTYTRMISYIVVNPDTLLLDSYEEGDLRLPLFFKPSGAKYQYSGSYNGAALTNYFTGLAVDELYLTRAECAVRLGNLEQGLADLNWLRKHRFKRGSYTERFSTDADELLGWIIDERRKELVWRGTRWEDLRRLNKEPRFAVTLTREIAGEAYTLPPGDKRYVWPIPVEAIEVGGYKQNPR